MSGLEHQIPEYLRQTLGILPPVSPWAGADRLPVFLTARYRFARIELEGRDLLLMLDEDPNPEPPAVIRKHSEQARTKWGGLVVYVRDQVTAYNRKRLIEQRVPFIVPGNQMYLPHFGLDLREYFRASAPSKRMLRPATQAVLTFVLLKRNRDDFQKGDTTAAALAPLLGYTTMTLSRAFDELESVGLATSETVGRERMLRFHTSPRETWSAAQPWLIDPVKSRHFVVRAPNGICAGADALSRYTMLAEPRTRVLALSHRAWLAHIEANPAAEVHDQDAATCEVEVWKYEPREHEKPRIVDPLSLFLSMQGRSTSAMADERVEQALDQLVEQIRW